MLDIVVQWSDVGWIAIVSLAIIAWCAIRLRSFAISHAVNAPEAWIPLFMRCCIVSVILLVVMILGSDWLRWYKEDRAAAAILANAVVTSTDRHGKRTLYSYKTPGASGSIYREDWDIPPAEILIAAAACGGAMIGVFSIAIGLGLVWVRERNLGFALDVLPEAQPADDPASRDESLRS